MNDKPTDNPVIDRVGEELQRVAARRVATPRRSAQRSVVLVLAALLGLLGTVTAASALTQAGPIADALNLTDLPPDRPRQGSGPPTFNTADGRAEPTVQQVDPRLRELMAVFRRPQRPDERLSDRGIELEDGENVTLSRRVDLPGTKQPVYVWPAQDAVCHAAGGFGGCPPIEVLEEQGIAIASGFNQSTPPGTIAIDGVARDGIAKLVFTMSDGRSVEVPVVENVFYRLLCGRPTAAAYVGVDGRRHELEQLPIPPLGRRSTADCKQDPG